MAMLPPKYGKMYGSMARRGSSVWHLVWQSSYWYGKGYGNRMARRGSIIAKPFIYMSSTDIGTI